MVIKNVSLDIVCGVTSTLPKTELPHIAFAWEQEPLSLKKRKQKKLRPSLPFVEKTLKLHITACP